MKECFKCHQTLPLSEFYKHPKMSDGRLGKCKECTKRDARSVRRAKIDYYRQYDVKRFHEDPHRRQYQFAATKELEAKYPDRMKARTTTSNAIRDGRLVRQPCEVCGITDHIEAHHDDYSKPLDVRWLCRRHHNEHHHPLEQAS